MLSIRTPRKPEELFQFSKNRLFITDNAKLQTYDKPLVLGKGKDEDPTDSASSPAPSLAEESKKKSLGLALARKASPAGAEDKQLCLIKKVL